MKNLIVFCIALITSSQAFSQSLEGIWQGHFYYDGPQLPRTHIALKIDSRENGSYNIHSYTRIPMRNGRDSVIICRIRYEQIGKQTFKLEEYQFINSNFNLQMQTMYLQLKIKKGKSMLDGRWESPDLFESKNKQTGTIRFTRK